MAAILQPSGLEEGIRYDGGHEAGMAQAEIEAVQVEIGVQRLGEEQAAAGRRVAGEIGGGDDRVVPGEEVGQGVALPDPRPPWREVVGGGRPAEADGLQRPQEMACACEGLEDDGARQARVGGPGPEGRVVEGIVDGVVAALGALAPGIRGA